MPLLRQLEFAFRSTDILPVGRPGVSPGELVSVGQALRLPDPETATGAVALQTQARDLLRAHGAARIASDLHVEWKAGLKTAAGRADCRQKLISLNPRLSEYPSEIDGLCGTSWRIFSRNFASADGGFYLTASNGSRPV